MGILAGRLNTKIEIWRPKAHLSPSGEVTLDEHGEPLNLDEHGQPSTDLTFQKFAWADIRAIRGSEKMSYGREQIAIFLYSVRIRFFDGLQVTDLFKFYGQLWGIKSMSPMGRVNREFIECMVEQLDVKDLIK